MTRYDTSTIHRYLDGVFANIPLTPDVQDLKEEIRGNLAARVAELEASGADPTAASRKAIKELGDIDEIIAQLGDDEAETPPVGAARSGAGRPRPHRSAPPGVRVSTTEAYLRNKVRPHPGYVARTVLLSLATAVGAVAYIIALVGGDSSWVLSAGAAACVVAIPIGLLVTDSLVQETTANHPLPLWRAIGYGLSTAVILGGLALLGLYVAASPRDAWLVMAGVPLVVLAIVAYSYLGATQTNRKKAWAREVEHDFFANAQPANRLEEDPAAAARFGIFSGILWITAIGAFIVLSIQIGFAWSWVAFFAALLIQMALVAGMVFPHGLPPSSTTQGK